MQNKCRLDVRLTCPCVDFQYAIKSIRKSQIETSQDLARIRREMARIRREIEIMSSLNHPHIISVYEGETIYLVF